MLGRSPRRRTSRAASRTFCTTAATSGPTGTGRCPATRRSSTPAAAPDGTASSSSRGAGVCFRFRARHARAQDYLEPARYYGFDSDAFSIESFVQFELGVLYPQLLAKRPTLRLERDWNVADVLGDARADVVLFASVLKKELAGDTRTDVLRRVRAALAPGGLVFVFADCDGDLRERAAAAGLALRLARHHGDCVFADDGYI